MEGRIIQLDRGEAVTEHNSITATTTGKKRKCNYNNAMELYFILVSGSGTWTIKIQGLAPDGTNWIDYYDNNGNQMAISSVTASKAQTFVGIPEIFRIVSTEDVNGATVTVAYKLFSV